MNEKLIKVFQDTKEQCQSNHLLKRSIYYSQLSQEFYDFDAYPLIERDMRRTTKVEVNHSTTLEAVRKWKKKEHLDRIGILNFASALACGGDVEGGRKVRRSLSVGVRHCIFVCPFRI